MSDQRIPIQEVRMEPRFSGEEAQEPRIQPEGVVIVPDVAHQPGSTLKPAGVGGVVHAGLANAGGDQVGLETPDFGTYTPAGPEGAGGVSARDEWIGALNGRSSEVEATFRRGLSQEAAVDWRMDPRIALTNSFSPRPPLNMGFIHAGPLPKYVPVVVLKIKFKGKELQLKNNMTISNEYWSRATDADSTSDGWGMRDAFREYVKNYKYLKKSVDWWNKKTAGIYTPPDSFSAILMGWMETAQSELLEAKSALLDAQFAIGKIVTAKKPAAPEFVAAQLKKANEAIKKARSHMKAKDNCIQSVRDAVKPPPSRENWH